MLRAANLKPLCLDNSLNSSTFNGEEPNVKRPSIESNFQTRSESSCSEFVLATKEGPAFACIFQL